MADDDEKPEDENADATDEEGEEGQDGEEGEGKPKKKSKKKLIIIIVAVLVLLGGGVGGAFMMGVIGGSKPELDPALQTDDAANKKTGQEVYMPLPDFLVNLNSSGRQSRFLKMTLVLELQKGEDESVIEAEMPRILDAFNAYLRELRPSDLYGSAGLYRLREALMQRLNDIVDPVVVNDLLFKQILVQ